MESGSRGFPEDFKFLLTGENHHIMQSGAAGLDCNCTQQKYSPVGKYHSRMEYSAEYFSDGLSHYSTYGAS